MKKKMVSVLLMATLVMASMAGCGGKTADKTAGEATGGTTEKAVETAGGESKNFKILSIWAEDSPEGSIIKGVTDQFIKEENQNFKYEYEYVKSSDLSTKVSTLMASDDLPDLFVYSAGKPLQDLIGAEKVVNISEALKEAGAEDSIMDAAKSSLISLSDTDDLYDLPFGMNIEGFWYNKELFAQAGVSEPKTWDEFLKVCDTLKEKGIQPLATAGADKWPTTRLVNAYAYRTMGKDAVKKACAGETKFTDEGFVKAANMVSEMAEKGYFGEGATTVDNTTAEDMLLSGKCAMIYDGSWFTGSITDEAKNPKGADNIGFIGVPVVDESISPATELPTNCGNILCLSKAKYDDVTKAWLKYFVTHVGDYAMDQFQVVKGYKYSTSEDKLSPVTKMVIEHIKAETSATAWWEAYMKDQTKATAQNNIQSLLNGDMDGEAYCSSIQEAYDLEK